MIEKAIYPALITPFDANDDIDIRLLEKLMGRLLDSGVKGFYIGGSTSECFLMDISEKKKIFETAASFAKGQASIICHVGSISGAEAAELARHAKTCGADAVSAIPPFYYKFKKREIINYYSQIADASDLPVILYYFPTFSGVEFTLDDFMRFYEDKRIAGVKFTSTNLYMMNMLRQKCPDWHIMNGHDEVFLPSLSAGADSAVGSTYNFMPKRFIKIMQEYKNGHMETAKNEQDVANRIISVLIEVGIYQGIKYILKRQGMDCGRCRSPFMELTPDEIQALENVMKLI